jgi:uncharacterized protein YbjT (DUF2867 family)
MPKVEYTAMLLGATGNVGRRILQLLVQSRLCKKVIVVTRRHAAELANPKVQQVVVNMETLEEEVAPHASGVDIALAAFGVGKGSAKMADEEVRAIEITYPTAFASAARAGGARVLAMMTAVGANSQSSTPYLRNIGDKEKRSEALGFDFLGLYRPAVILGNSNTHRRHWVSSCRCSTGRCRLAITRFTRTTWRARWSHSRSRRSSRSRRATAPRLRR